MTPTTCGVKQTTAAFYAVEQPVRRRSVRLDAVRDHRRPRRQRVHGRRLPFAPTLTAGSTTDQAGGYTDFSMLLQRGDGQQRFSSLLVQGARGAVGMIASVPLCGEAAGQRGTCSAASQIGHTVVGAGPGPYPLFIPQQKRRRPRSI